MVFKEVAVEVESFENAGGQVEIRAFVEERLMIAEEKGDGEIEK